jgi:hypothetical protein
MIKLKFGVFIGLLASSINLMAQDPAAQPYGKLITEADLKENLSILASDAFEGRETGKRGQKIAAAFISAYFEDIGLSAPVNGSYLQPVELFVTAQPAVSLKSNGIELKEFEDFTYYGNAQTDLKELQLVFVGNGTDAEIGSSDFKGKAVAFFLGSDASIRRNPVITKLREKGAALVIAITNKQEDFVQLTEMIKMYSSGSLSLTNTPSQSASDLGLFLAGPSTCEKLFKMSEVKLRKAISDKKVSKVKPSALAFSIKQSFTPLKTSNVLGFLEGTDKKDEIVIVTAHYDHIGISKSGEGDRINNGADDDGSGTVAVMQLAKVFAQAKKDGKGPRRSILFMTVTGEEKGLLGSDYYTQHPIFPLNKTVVDLNIDMIGRRDPGHKDSAPYVYVIGADKLSAELHTLSESVNKANHNLIFDYTYNSESHPDRIYYRSDHWNFAKNNIPIIFYFDGVHEDYHKPSDEVDKIEFDLLAKRAQTVFFTAWEIANRENRIVADKK